MSNIKNGGNPDHDRSPIINGLMATAESTVNYQKPLNDRFYPSDEAIVHSLHDNLGTIMTAARDVFLSPFDLALLDHSHGVLGGVEFLIGQPEISEALEALSPRLPTIWTQIGFAYFVPALTMPLAARMKFFQLSGLEKLKVALKTKRVFVNGEVFQVYGGSGKQVPDPGFWAPLFDFNADHTPTDFGVGEAGADLGPTTSLAFSLERSMDRNGGDGRFIDRLADHELVCKDPQNITPSLRARVMEWGRKHPKGSDDLKHFGAAPGQTAVK